jgi:hypothetical protein
LSDLQASEIESITKQDSLNVMKTQQRGKQTQQNWDVITPVRKTKCRFSGYEYPHKSGKCQASG